MCQTTGLTTSTEKDSSDETQTSTTRRISSFLRSSTGGVGRDGGWFSSYVSSSSITSTNDESNNEDDDEPAPSFSTNYTIDDSSSPIKIEEEAHDVNRKLNLNLGLTDVLPDPMNPTVRATLRRFVRCFEWLERILVALWIAIPLSFRHWLTMKSWSIYHPLHKLFLGRTTGIHPSVSEEYHSFTTVCFWGRYFPVSIERMRLALNQIQVLYPYTGGTMKATHIHDEEHNVSGVYLHYNNDCGGDATSSDTNVRATAFARENSNRRGVIYWIYGGAFLGGDVLGNLGVAERYGKRCQCDVFVVDYRLLPEHELDDAVDDVCRGYDYLVNILGVPSSEVQLFGISSGGGLAVQLMQRLAAASADKDKKEQEIATGRKVATNMPAGAVLMCPFVDLTEPKGSLLHYTRHDLDDIMLGSIINPCYPMCAYVASPQNRMQLCIVGVRRRHPVHGEEVGLSRESCEGLSRLWQNERPASHVRDIVPARNVLRPGHTFGQPRQGSWGGLYTWFVEVHVPCISHAVSLNPRGSTGDTFHLWMDRCAVLWPIARHTYKLRFVRPVSRHSDVE